MDINIQFVIGLLLGNLGYQYYTTHEYAKAVAVAILESFIFGLYFIIKGI